MDHRRSCITLEIMGNNWRVLSGKVFTYNTLRNKCGVALGNKIDSLIIGMNGSIEGYMSQRF